MNDSCFVYYPTKREFLLEIIYFVHSRGEDKENKNKKKKGERRESKFINMHQYICSHSLSIVRGPKMIDSYFNTENHITPSVGYTSNLSFDS